MEILLFNIIHSLVGKSMLLDGFTVFLAKYLVYFLVLGTIFFIFSFRGVKTKLFAFLLIALTAILARGILTEVIRFFYDRKRPYEALGFEPLFIDPSPSFPSGHTAFLFALTFAVFYFSRFWGFWFLGFSLLVGLSRAAAGVHWPSDILGGIAVALISFWAVWNLLRRYRPEEALFRG